MQKHDITWAAPSPFWPDATGTDVTGINRPAILRFASDSFMDDYMSLLSTDPLRLGEFRAKPETWRGPTPASDDPLPVPQRAFGLPLQRAGITRRRTPGTRPTQSLSTTSLLKLYQPIHQRFYLISAALVCQRTGMPDRKIDFARQERASFLVRRLLPPTTDKDSSFNLDTWEEHAFVATTPGKFAWQLVDTLAGHNPTDPTAYLVDGEERLPLFQAHFTEDDQRDRRLLSGLIPVGRRDAYMGAPKTSPNSPTGIAGTTPKTVRKVLFRSLVAEPWKALVDTTLAYLVTINPPDSNDTPNAQQIGPGQRRLREQLQLISWLIIIDFADFLDKYLPNIANALKNSSTLGAGAEADVLATLKATTLDVHLTDAPNTERLQLVEQDETHSQVALGTPNACAGSLADMLAWFLNDPARALALEKSTTAYTRQSGVGSADFPAYLFPLVDPKWFGTSAIPQIPQPPGFAVDSDDGDLQPIETQISITPPNPNTAPYAADAATYKLAIDKLAALIVRALPAISTTISTVPEPAPSAASQPAADRRQGWFVIRCIYERPKCGPLHDDVVSVPTEPFVMAAFFDPDAPARPVRIGLPIDTSPAGLRKFDKNTMFEMSDILCGQIKRMKGITFGDLVLSILPWPFHKDLSAPDGGPCKDGMGTICSLSIPIITICALILLMIMVALLDIIFHWMPFLIMCFPVPKFAAKSRT